MNKLSRIGKVAFTGAIFVFIISTFLGGSAPRAVQAEPQSPISGRLRFVPITVGDLMLSTTQEVGYGDAVNGPVFPHGTQSGGSITFPLPEDYVLGTTLSLDLFLIPMDSGTGNVDFFVRWVGLSDGSWSGTGTSVTSSPVPVGTVGFIIKKSFTLPGMTAPLPEIMELTIRRNNASSDSYTGRVSLIGLRLVYQSSWSSSYLPTIAR